MTFALLASAAAPATAAASGQDVFLALSAFRQHHGLPAIREDPELSAACRALMAHRQANGGQVGTRSEWPEAARVLSWWVDPGSWGSGGQRPTALYPRADAGLLNPMMTVVGVADGCLGFKTETPPVPATGQLAVFPGEGSTDAPFDIIAGRELREGNLSEFLGGPARTGPYIRVFAWGGGFSRNELSHLIEADVSATLVDQREQAVPLRAGANGQLAWSAGVGTAVIVPTVPLRPREWYRATVAYAERYTGMRAERTWRFRTAGLSPDTNVSVSANGELEVMTNSAASLRVRLTRGEKTAHLGPFGRGATVVPLPVEPGRYRMCIEQAAVGPYEGVDRCEDVQRSWAAPVQLRARRLRGDRVRLTATAPAVATGLALRARILGYKVGRKWVRIGKGTALRGTLGTRSARWTLTGRAARRSVTALLTETEAGTGLGNAGQRWLPLRRRHEVRITRR
ncbi:MAG: hypothetical protein ACEQSX_06575 [Baekduiaceae bacterium]